MRPNHPTRPRWVSAVATLTAAGCAGSALLLATAQPARADVAAQIRAAQATLDQLNASAEQAAERYDAGRLVLAHAQAQTTRATAALAVEQSALERVQHRADGFLAATYMGGPAGQAVDLIGTTNPDQVLGKLGVLDSIARRQAAVLAELATAHHRQAQARADAQAQQQAAQLALTQLRSDKDKVVSSGVQAQAVLVRLQVEQAQLVQAARDAAARRAALQRQAALAAQADLAARALAAFRAQPQVEVPPAQATAAPLAKIQPVSVSAPAPVSAPVQQGGSAASEALSVALSELGKAYVYGAAGPDSFDCSGLIMYSYGRAGISLPHYAADQYNQGRHIDRSELQPGDLVFFDNLGHVGIYAGSDQFIHAPHSGTVVQYGTMAGYWDQHYVGAVRLAG